MKSIFNEYSSTIIVAMSLCAVNLPAKADPPKAESFVVADIHFGDSAKVVVASAGKLGMKLTRESNYARSGSFGETLAFQEFQSANFMEKLSVQYSRVTTVVVGIERTANFSPPLNTTVVIESIVQRFGTGYSQSFVKIPLQSRGMFDYTWDSQDKQITNNVRCETLGLPSMSARQDCGFAAHVSLGGQSNGYTSLESINVMDWSTHFKEIAEASRSASENSSKELEKNRGRAVPKL